MRDFSKILIALAFILFASPDTAFAQANTTDVVVAKIEEELRTAGYTNMSQRRTWLGRLRIRAERGEYIREIIINPRTGEVLRDYHFELEDRLFGGDDDDDEDHSNDREEDDDDEDDEEDEDDEDEGEEDDGDDGEEEGGDEEGNE